MKTILITGGAGFIGRNLAEKLYGEGNRIIILDRVRKDINQSPGYLYHELDIRYPITDLVDSAIDEIYHLACPASPVQYSKDPIDTLDTAIQGTSNVLELARINQCKIVIASTSEIYGDPFEHPQSEFYNGNVNTTSDRACYQEGKRAAETYARLYYTEYGVDTRVVRIFNTYGPHMALNDGRVIPEFIKAALLRGHLKVANGSQTRSFCYVEDTVNGLIAAMNCKKMAAFTFPVNIGNDDERTIMSVAQYIVDTIGQGIIVSDEPYKIGAMHRKPSLIRAKQILNWSPTVSFEEGIARTIADIKERL